jgi:hypothetical protein
MLATAADVRHDGRGRGCQCCSGGDLQCDPPKAKRDAGQHDPPPVQRSAWDTIFRHVADGSVRATRQTRSKVSPTALRFAGRAEGAPPGAGSPGTGIEHSG